MDQDELNDNQGKEKDSFPPGAPMPMPIIMSEPTAQVRVDASGEGVYHVTHFKGMRRDWECECAAFRVLGKSCKHIGLAKAALRSKTKPEGVIDVWKGIDWK